jgi:ribonuclease D
LQHIITSTAALAELAERLAAAPAVGLDTEFLRERTYRAELCLIQVSDAQQAACVDPLALTDLAPLASVLTAARTVKVMHASRQDIEVLLPAVGFVQPVFDTQIAAALTGLPAQIGYGELVRRVLGRDLPKGHTRTDWTQRPLSPDQIEYALDDVRYLLPLKAHLEEQLHGLGRLEWLRQELADLADTEAFVVDPSRAWLRVKGLRGFDEGRTRLARELAAWRERRAVDRNRPRGWILDDAVLREIVQRVPRTLDALGVITDMPRAVVERSGEDLLQLIRGAAISDPPPPLPARTRPDPALTALVKKLSTVNQATAAELNLSPEVLATRRDLEQLAEGNRDVHVLQGWRKDVIGDRLIAALG